MLAGQACSVAFVPGDNGGWSLAVRETFDDAKAQSLKACQDKQQPGCRVGASLGPFQFGCMAIAKKPDVGLPSSATGGGLSAVRNAALAACSRANGDGCELAYSACND